MIDPLETALGRITFDFIGAVGGDPAAFFAAVAPDGGGAFSSPTPMAPSALYGMTSRTWPRYASRSWRQAGAGRGSTAAAVFISPPNHHENAKQPQHVFPRD
jgi:hypothetical protein